MEKYYKVKLLKDVKIAGKTFKAGQVIEVREDILNQHKDKMEVIADAKQV